MTAFITIAGAVVYLAVCAVTVWTAKRRPDLTARVWNYALALASFIAGVNLIAGEWLTGGIWVFNAAVCAFSSSVARRWQRDREINEFFQS